MLPRLTWPLPAEPPAVLQPPPPSSPPATPPPPFPALRSARVCERTQTTQQASRARGRTVASGEPRLRPRALADKHGQGRVHSLQRLVVGHDELAEQAAGVRGAEGRAQRGSLGNLRSPRAGAGGAGLAEREAQLTQAGLCSHCPESRHCPASGSWCLRREEILSLSRGTATHARAARAMSRRPERAADA